MAVAVTAGQLISLLPQGLVDVIVTVLFLAGAAYLWITSFRSQNLEGVDAARQGNPPPSFVRIAGTSFGVVFLAEWGDITQITTANLAARSNRLVVFAGSVLALWLIAALAVTLGAKSLDLIPMAWVRRITATILLALGIYTAITALFS
jgi:putative Ca2+/H+ antiporter (TMEM165/GDT1 family)